MGAFLRQMVAMAALWTLEELLLPEGNLQKAARVVVSLLVMTVLLSSMVDLLRSWDGQNAAQWTQELGAIAWESSQGVGEEQAQAGYARYYLQSQANQAQALCLRMAQKAGYRADAAVYLQQDGALERIQLRLEEPGEGEGPPLIPAQELRRAIAAAFEAEEARVQVVMGEGG
ncbi:MAG: stage III sporulation protein AF [Candidatus Limiplasma sp.]|nr:stage III sporulation protein AF [Candidatus Limiplasma sp.]